MRDDLRHLSDRELLETIYTLLINMQETINRLGDEDRQFALNLTADLLSNALQNKSN